MPKYQWRFYTTGTSHDHLAIHRQCSINNTSFLHCKLFFKVRCNIKHSLLLCGCQRFGSTCWINNPEKTDRKLIRNIRKHLSDCKVSSHGKPKIKIFIFIWTSNHKFWYNYKVLRCFRCSEGAVVQFIIKWN